ncbi:conserved hypothetical protein [Paraburkholderia unamae]|uniref:hypothetical protein n=1 Tax=Paraburkholderia unamae TaxID=219649 RepID=UPI000DC5AC93|nr:hypothetical protein [Paraburkholderia unamae]RAR56199.1 hypothetical protein C7401_12063 [Paraburkholderia unamae]CAG9245259.1 conserved hypothetical protein [Paraburkholderia unamae]
MSASKPKTPQPSQDDPLDEALEETFPASDPVAIDPKPAASQPKPQSSDKSHKGHDSHRHGKH